MSKEKIILSIVAALLGLAVAGGAFYIYQMTRAIDEPEKKDITQLQKQLSPTPQSANFLILESPKDEEVLDNRLITVSGKTVPGSTVIVASETADQVIQPATNGSFTASHSIGEGVNIIRVTVIFPTGEEQSITRTVTYSTEDF